jgi:hypothetical protein
MFLENHFSFQTAISKLAGQGVMWHLKHFSLEKQLPKSDHKVLLTP